MPETKEQAVARFATAFAKWCAENDLDATSMENVRRWAGVTFGKVPSDSACKKIAEKAGAIA